MNRARSPAAAGGPWSASPLFRALLSEVLCPSPDGGVRLATHVQRGAADLLDGACRPLLPRVTARLQELGAEPLFVAEATRRLLATSQINLARVGRALAAIRSLDAGGVPALTLKSTALSLVRGRSHSTRVMADVDILVRPEDVSRAGLILEHDGWSSSVRRTQRTLSTRVHHAVSYVDGPMNALDLHWRLFPGSALDADASCWAAAERHQICGTPIRVLAPADQVFHLCVHAVQPVSTPSAAWILDVLAVLDHAGSNIQWTRVAELAAATATTVRVRAAIHELARCLDEHQMAGATEILAAQPSLWWEAHELRHFSRLPPYSLRDRLRRHYHRFTRLRRGDTEWRRWPAILGFADYVQRKLRTR